MSGRSICKTSCLQFFLNGRDRGIYENYLYFGDGPNDLCPCLKIGFHETNAKIFPRKGFRLETLLKNYCIQADIIPWSNGEDLYQSMWNTL